MMAVFTHIVAVHVCRPSTLGAQACVGVSGRRTRARRAESRCCVHACRMGIFSRS